MCDTRLEMIFIKYWMCLMWVTMFYMVFAETQDIKSRDYVNLSFIRLLKDIVKVNEKRMALLKKLTVLDDYALIHTRSSDDYDDDYEEMEKHHVATAKNVILALLDIIHAKAKYGKTRKSTDQRKQEYKLQFSPVDIVHTRDAKPKTEPNKKLHGTETKENIARIRPINENKEEMQLNEVSSSESAEFLTIETTKERDDLEIDIADNDSKIAVSVGYNNVSVIVENIRRSWMNSCSKKASKVCRNACTNAHRNFCRIYSCSSRAKNRFKRECRISCKTKFVTNRYSDIE